MAHRVVPGTPLLVGANRDELLDRPTTLMTVLQARDPRIIGGRDEHSGGTWLAINEHGVVAALTNQPLGDAKDLTLRTRGELPLIMAAARTAADGAAALIERARPQDYNGAWLMVADRDDLFFVDFTGESALEALALPPGVHVLENKPLGAPSAKVARVHELLDGLSGDVESATVTLEKALGDHWVPEGDAEPDAPPRVANCVHLEKYGTRSSCLVRVGADQAALPDVRVAAGPPCTTPFSDANTWWRT